MSQFSLPLSVIKRKEERQNRLDKSSQGVNNWNENRENKAEAFILLGE